MDVPEKGVPLANIVELRMALLWDIREPHWDGSVQAWLGVCSLVSPSFIGAFLLVRLL